jgi:hypothetical protein
MVQQLCVHFLSSYCFIFYCSTLSCLCIPTLVFILGKEKKIAQFLIPLQQCNQPYHVTTNSFALSRLF